MKLLPFASFSFIVPLSPEGVGEILNTAIQPLRPWNQRRAKGEEDYEGFVSDGKFQISRVPTYTANFSFPILHGVWHPHQNGTQFQAKMSFDGSTWLFAIVFFGGLVGLNNWKDGLIIGDVVSVTLMLVVYVVAISWFGREVRKAERFLRNLPWGKIG